MRFSWKKFSFCLTLGICTWGDFIFVIDVLLHINNDFALNVHVESLHGLDHGGLKIKCLVFGSLRKLPDCALLAIK